MSIPSRLKLHLVDITSEIGYWNLVSHLFQGQWHCSSCKATLQNNEAVAITKVQKHVEGKVTKNELKHFCLKRFCKEHPIADRHITRLHPFTGTLYSHVKKEQLKLTCEEEAQCNQVNLTIVYP